MAAETDRERRKRIVGLAMTIVGIASDAILNSGSYLTYRQYVVGLVFAATLITIGVLLLLDRFPRMRWLAGLSIGVASFLAILVLGGGKRAADTSADLEQERIRRLSETPDPTLPGISLETTMTDVPIREDESEGMDRVLTISNTYRSPVFDIEIYLLMPENIIRSWVVYRPQSSRAQVGPLPMNPGSEGSLNAVPIVRGTGKIERVCFPIPEIARIEISTLSPGMYVQVAMRTRGRPQEKPDRRPSDGMPYYVQGVYRYDELGQRTPFKFVAPLTYEPDARDVELGDLVVDDGILWLMSPPTPKCVLKSTGGTGPGPSAADLMFVPSGRRSVPFE